MIVSNLYIYTERDVYMYICVYIYIYIYIYILLLLLLFNNFDFSTNAKKHNVVLYIFIYAENDTESHTTFKLTIDNTERTQTTNIYFQSPIIFKNIHSFESAFSAHLYGQAGNYF